MIKKFKPLLLILLVTLGMTGCFKRDSLEGIDIMTTVYPIEFVTNYLYGEHSVVNSIYPDGVDTATYELSEKQFNDYSKTDLFVYNRITEDRDTALEFLDRNNDMLLIDGTHGMEYTYGEEELWLNPSNLLMIAQNIKNGLQEYMTNSYLEKEIDARYEEIKVTLSELDADLKLTAENATNKTLIVNSDSLKFLTKYGFEVISLDSSNTSISDRVVADVKAMIEDGSVRHIFLLENKENSDVVDEIIEDTEVETYTFRKLDSITDAERDEKIDYFQIMENNIELLRDELY